MITMPKFLKMNKDGATGPRPVILTILAILTILTSIWLNPYLSQIDTYCANFFTQPIKTGTTLIVPLFTTDGDLLRTTFATQGSAQNPLLLDDPSRPRFLNLLAKTLLIVPTRSLFNQSTEIVVTPDNDNEFYCQGRAHPFPPS
jgi:hypothetical protein